MEQNVHLPRLRSRNNNEKAYVRFVNSTPFCVELIWINYEGEYKRYKLLKNGTYVDINTFKFHPWIALDAHDKYRMHINNELTYWPKTTREHLLENPNMRHGVIPDKLRKIVHITLPVYSLRYRTMLELAKYFKKPDDVTQLELPTHLLDDLKTLITSRNGMNVQT